MEGEYSCGEERKEGMGESRGEEDSTLLAEQKRGCRAGSKTLGTQ